MMLRPMRPNPLIPTLIAIRPPLGNEKSTASSNENQPRVEQEMLWARLLKVKPSTLPAVL
jgi:hypothetical protein